MSKLICALGNLCFFRNLVTYTLKLCDKKIRCNQNKYYLKKNKKSMDPILLH